MSQIEKPDDLQLIANHPVFFVCMMPDIMEITQNILAVNLTERVWRADLSGAAFGKITAVYGHIEENGAFIRKWLWLIWAELVEQHCI